MMDRIRLDKICKFKKFIKRFEKSNVHFFDEIEYLDFEDLKNKLGISFADTITISNIIKEVKLNNKYCHYNEKTNENNLENLVDISNKGFRCSTSDNEIIFPFIVDLGLSVRSTNALLNHGCTSLEDIINLDETDLVNIQNLGRKSVDEILEIINKFKNNELIINSRNCDITNINVSDIKVLPRIHITRDLFDVRTFNCLQKNEIHFIDEVITLNLNDFSSIEGVGNNVINALKNIINLYKNVYFYNFYNDGNNFLTEVYKFDKNELIMDNYNISNRAKSFLINLGYVTLGDVLNVSDDTCLKTADTNIQYEIKRFKLLLNFVQNVNFTPYLCMLENTINNFKYKKLKLSKFHFLISEFELLNSIDNVENYTLEEIFNFIKESNNKDLIFEFYYIFNKYLNIYPFEINVNITDEKLDICMLREKYTLEEIGHKYGKTRERIRQIVEKEKSKIIEYAKTNDINFLFLEDICRRDYNNSLLSDESYNKWFDLLYLFNNFEKITFNNEVIYVRKSIFEKYRDILTQLETDIFDKGYLLVEEVNYDTNNLVFSYLMSQTKIRMNNYTYYIADTTNKKVLSYIKRNGIIDLSEKKINETIIELERLLDVYDFDKHNVSNGLLGYGCCPLGDGSYTLLEFLPDFDQSIYDLIRDHIKTHEIIFCKTFFYEYKDIFPKEYNPNSLYFKLKQKFGDEFYYSKGSLAISVIENPSKANLVYNYLISSNCPVENSKLYSFYELDNIGLFVISGQNDDIIKFDNISYWCLSKVNIDDCKDSIIKYINRKKSFFINDLYYYIGFDYNHILKENHILNLENFYNVISKMFKEELKQFDYDIKHKKFIYKEVQINQDYDDFDF